MMDNIPDTAQHYIECDTKLCRNYSDFYCNTCHQKMCCLCRETHLKKMDNRNHDVVSFRDRKRKPPSEKCRNHPTNYINVYCDDCQVPVCITCFAEKHKKHIESDLETVYNDTLQECQKELTKIWETVIPKAKDNVLFLSKKAENSREEIDSLRLIMKKKADELKEAVDSILADNNEKLDNIEETVINDLVKQQQKTEDYIKDLNKMITDYESKMSSITPTELTRLYMDISLATLKMPTVSQKLPIFRPGTLRKEDIAKTFGEIKLNSFEENISKTLWKLSSSVTMVKEVPLLELHKTFHLSLLTSDKFWANDYCGNIIQSDMEGKILQKVSTNIRGIASCHAVSIEKELLYIKKKAVFRMTSDSVNSTNKLISTGDWVPEAIYSSHKNGHILVGLRNEQMKLVRYSKEGRKLQDIQWDDKGCTLYKSIHYITENINGDICTSDYWARKVVVVTRLGRYRFSYSGRLSQSLFHPYGICTDVLGHILVCNGYAQSYRNVSSVHMLDQSGQFISFLLTSDQCPRTPRALCVDDQHNLWVGCSENSSITVYNYLQITSK